MNTPVCNLQKNLTRKPVNIKNVGVFAQLFGLQRKYMVVTFPNNMFFPGCYINIPTLKKIN